MQRTLVFSIACHRKGSALDVGSALMKLLVHFHLRTGLDYIKAAVRLMSLMLSQAPLLDETEDETLLKSALMPLVRNRDGHFLATLSAFILSLLEGKTDCPISGVFGAGKTRAAAATIAGLITVDPSLKIMILTQENVASQAISSGSTCRNGLKTRLAD